MRGLGSIGSAYFRRRRGRSLLTGSGVVLGVAVLFGVLVSNASAEDGFDQLSRRLSGDADVTATPIGTEGARLPDGVVDDLRALPGVTDVTSSLDVAAAEGDGSAFQLVGVDDKAAEIADFPLVEGRLPQPRADEIIVTVDHGLDLGEVISVVTATGDHDLKVVGVLDEEGVGTLDDGNARFTSLATAQRLTDEPGAVDHVNLVLDDGVDEEAWLDDYEFELTGAHLTDAQEIFFGGGFGDGLLFVAAISLFIAAFLIYLTLSGAVIERVTVYGTLRALGSSRRQVTRVVVREALWLGTFASAVGLLVGLLLGFLLSRALASVADLPTSGLRVPIPAIVISLLIGIGVSVVAAYIPARRAGRLSPVVAMRGDVVSRTRLSRAWLVGIVLAVVGLSTMNGGGPLPLLLLGQLLFFVGVVLLIPPVLGPVAAVVGFVLRRLTHGTTNVTVMHLVKERNRSAYTLGLILVVIAFGISIGAVRESFYRLAEETIAESTADVTVLSPTPITESTVEQVAAVDGIEMVSELRYGTTSVIDGDVELFTQLSVVDPETYFEVQSMAWEDGDDASARAGFSAGGSVAISDPLATLLDIEVGDDIVLRTADGEQPFDVVGTYTGTGGFSVTTGLVDGSTHFRSGQPVQLVASIDDDADAGSVREEVRRTLHAGDETSFDDADFNVIDPEIFLADIKANISSQLYIFSAVVAVAMLAGLLGLANTLAMSVLQRTREIGLMRAVGAHTREVGWMIAVEALLLGGLAYLIALPVGILTSGSFISIVESIGFTPKPDGVGPTAYLLAIVALVVALVAAFFPARRAARLNITNALRVE